MLQFAARFSYRGPGPALTARSDETLELVGLRDGEAADRPVRGLSGGERLRLGIAQAHVTHPDLLILDEPAASLDPGGRRDVLDIITRLRSRATVFYSTHTLDDVQRVTDRVAIVDRGRLVTNAPTADLLDGDTVTYEITVRGGSVATAQALRTRAGVRDVTCSDRIGATTLTVRVRDHATADGLLPVVLAGGDVVTAFGRRQSSLEEVFLALVEGDRR